MNQIKFVITDDNTTGLFSTEANDIFHSKTGALKEAREKFIEPSFLSELFHKKESIKILDICYGIGYNTKSALSIMPDEYPLCIDCFEYNKSFVEISPFIRDGIDDLELKLFLLSGIEYTSFKHIKEFDEEILRNFFRGDLIRLIVFLEKEVYFNTPHPNCRGFLHNIYYRYISNREKQSLNPNKYKNSKIRFFIGDARENIKKTNNLYDIVFLDAFSPQKDPSLWTIDFLSQLKNKMNYDSILVTYSKSTPLRSALKKLGFHVGKTLIDNIDMGTSASLNKNKIINPLNSFDLGLLNTRSGIPYKDPNLSLTANEIIRNRENEQNVSELLSHTQYLKKFGD